MDDITIGHSIIIPESAVRFSYSRSGGKGGQNVNKVSTKVDLFFAPADLRCSQRLRDRIMTRLSKKMDSSGTIRISSKESRSQWQNKQTAIDKLIAMVEDAAIEEKDRIATKPTRSSKVRRVDRKKLDSRRKLLRRKQVHHGDE